MSDIQPFTFPTTGQAVPSAVYGAPITPKALQRFFAKVSVTSDGCWLWTARVRPDGYGSFRWGSKMVLAHRLSYLIFRTDIAAGLELDHLCHTRDEACPGGTCLHRQCVNPEHLEPVSHRINALRGRSETANNAVKSHCDRGHAFDAGNTYVRIDGHRQCRRCEADRKARERAAKRLGGTANVADLLDEPVSA